VLRLDRRAAGQELPFESVSDRIVRQLSTQSWQRAVSQYLRILAGRASIEGIGLNGVATPLGAVSPARGQRRRCARDTQFTMRLRKNTALTAATIATTHSTSSEPSPPSGENPNHCSMKSIRISLVQGTRLPARE
jgi:hypothetical protein